MKKSKKFVLAGLVLLAAITGLLALAGCKDAAGGGGSEYQFPAGVKVLTGHQGTASPTSFPPVEGAVYVEAEENAYGMNYKYSDGTPV